MLLEWSERFLDPVYQVTTILKQIWLWEMIIFRNITIIISRGTDAVDFRSKNIESIESLQNNSIDFYASVKSLYLQKESKKYQMHQSLIKSRMIVIGKKLIINNI